MLGQSQAVTPVTLARCLTFGNLRGDGCAVQLSPVLYSREGTADKVVRTIHELGRQELQFATLPIPWSPTPVLSSPPCSVKAHQGRVMRKMQADSLADLVRMPRGCSSRRPGAAPHQQTSTSE